MFLFNQTVVVFWENPRFHDMKPQTHMGKPARSHRPAACHRATRSDGPFFWGWLGLAHSHNHDIGNMPHFPIGHIHLYRNGGFFPSVMSYIFFIFFSGLMESLP